MVETTRQALDELNEVAKGETTLCQEGADILLTHIDNLQQRYENESDYLNKAYDAIREYQEEIKQLKYFRSTVKTA